MADTFRVFASRANNQAVGLGMTDRKGGFWLADLEGHRISDFCANRGQVIIAARRAFGPCHAGDMRVGLFPGEEFVRADWSF